MRTMTLPKVNHIAPNFTEVEVGDLTIWFSYSVPVAFSVNSGSAFGIVVRENDFSTTTGRHLSQIDQGDAYGKARRIPGPAFEHALSLLVTGEADDADRLEASAVIVNARNK